MTQLAETPSPLKRLFDRIDFAPQPRCEALTLLLSHWADKRKGMVAPRPRDISAAQLETDAGLAVFTYRVRAGERDYSLMSGRRALEPLLGACEPGSSLREAPRRRDAVRLRRLFEEVRRTGEPVLADFAIARDREVRAQVEVIVAPLAEDGRSIDALLGGLSIRPVREAIRRVRRPRDPAELPGPLVFALGTSRGFGERVASHLGLTLSSLEEREFEDGEHKARPLTNVRDRDVYVIHSLYRDKDQSPNDKLCRLLFFIGTLKDAAAARVTAVVPYLCYARKDRQTKARDPIATRYVAQLFEAVGTDRVITLEVHNPAAYQNAFRCDTEHLEAANLFAAHFCSVLGETPLAVVSPDLGGGKRAEAFRERLEALLGRPIAKGFMDKQRSMGKVTGDLFAGDVSGRTVIIVDDLISTGTTMARVAACCRRHGAQRISVAAAHGLFTAGADALWREPAIDEVVVTNTVPLTQCDGGGARHRLTVLDASEIFADAISRCHSGGSITELAMATTPPRTLNPP
jgi:ribose-phosphate pyrophosphokinase